jgi:hypothetical protein
MAMLLDQRVARGLWNIPILWLSTPLCFFAYDHVVALPVLGLFLFLVWRFWRSSSEEKVRVLREISGLFDHSGPGETA